MEQSDAEFESRRSLLVAGVWSIVGGIGVVITSILGIATIAPIGGRREENWIDAGPEGALGSEPQRLAVNLELRQGWSVENRTEIYYGYKDEQGNVIVFDSQCTHLGCAVRWSESSGNFECPCHGGRFARNGEVEAGPPSSALPRPRVRIENSRILIERS